MRLARATIRGDRAAYESATAELRATIEAAASFVIQAALTAVLTPAAGAIFRASSGARAAMMTARITRWAEAVSVNTVSSIGANVILHNDYSLAMLKADLLNNLGGTLGADAVGKMLGPVAAGLAERLGKKCSDEILAFAKTVGNVEGGAWAQGLEGDLTLQNVAKTHLMGKGSEAITSATASALGLPPAYHQEITYGEHVPSEPSGAPTGTAEPASVPSGEPAPPSAADTAARPKPGEPGEPGAEAAMPGAATASGGETALPSPRADTVPERMRRPAANDNVPAPDAPAANDNVPAPDAPGSESAPPEPAGQTPQEGPSGTPTGGKDPGGSPSTVGSEPAYSRNRGQRPEGVSATLQDVLPEMRASSSVADRYTARLIETGWLYVQYIEDLPRVANHANECAAREVDPRTHSILELPPGSAADTVIVGEHDTGVTISDRHILIRRGLPPEQVAETLRHEANHALRDMGHSGSKERYRAEFDAYWMDGSFDHLPNRDARARAIRDHVLDSYPEIEANMAVDPALADTVRDYRRPEGNVKNSPTWSIVERVLGSGEPGRQLRALQAIERADPDERRELRSSHQFLELLSGNLTPADLAMARRLLDGA
jgi:hypothetical protein